MDHYVDIAVLPDPEFPSTMLMNALYAKLHRALATVGSGEIGVSFPRAGKAPGDLLRLHAGKDALTRLMEQNWLRGLNDYTCSSQISEVPAEYRHIQVKRVQPKLTAARLRRAVKRGSILEEEAEKLLMERSLLKNPFFQLNSQSTGQRFPLFIQQQKPQVEARTGSFNSYGLSDQATVPWF